MEIIRVQMHSDHDGAVIACTYPVDFSQKRVKPTTHTEFSVLLSGNCPACGSTLAGENGKFCVPDQTFWEFDPDQPVTSV